jgi:type 1 fimbria pilin
LIQQISAEIDNLEFQSTITRNPMKPSKSSKSLIRHAMRPLAFYLLTLLNSGHAGASEGGSNSIQLRVIGSLVPPACTLALPSGGTIDYGRIQHSELAASGNTILTERNIAFSINCDAPAMVALMLQDEQPGSVVQDLIKSVRDDPDGNAVANGLGAVNGVNIGIYYVRVFVGPESNNRGTLRTLRSEGLESWSETPVDAPLYANGTRPLGFSSDQATVPTALSTVSGRLAIQPLIRPRTELPGGDEIALAGSSTLTLYYR